MQKVIASQLVPSSFHHMLSKMWTPTLVLLSLVLRGIRAIEKCSPPSNLPFFWLDCNQLGYSEFWYGISYNKADNAVDSRKERRGRRTEPGCPLGRQEPRPRRTLALHGLSPRLPDARRRPDTGQHASASPRDRRSVNNASSSLRPR